MATKKPAPKAVKTIKKPTKAVAKKPTPKPAAKKVVAKKPAPKPVAKKVVAKKPAPKPAAKKVVAKKPAPKPVAKKVVAKKPTPKPVAKKAVAQKPTPKPVVKKVEVVKPPKKEIIVKAPKEPKPKKGPKVNTKTIISPSTPILPKKSDVFRPTVSNIPTLRNDTGKVIAHRKTSEMKRKAQEDDSRTMIEYVPEYNKSILDLTAEDKGPRYRYSDEDLQEFRELITKKLETARNELHYLQGLITRKDEAGTDDTENKFAGMEEGSESHDREQLNQLASRQIKFIGNLEQAMVRVENKTYGICRVTGKLIDKARLRAVPHATLSIDAKNAMNKN